MERVEQCVNFSELRIKTPERRQWSCFDIFIVNCEQISLWCFIVDIEQVMPARIDE